MQVHRPAAKWQCASSSPGVAAGREIDARCPRSGDASIAASVPTARIRPSLMATAWTTCPPVHGDDVSVDEDGIGDENLGDVPAAGGEGEQADRKGGAGGLGHVVHGR